MFPGGTLESPTVKTLVSRNSAVSLPEIPRAPKSCHFYSILQFPPNLSGHVSPIPAAKKVPFFCSHRAGARHAWESPMRLDGWMGTCIEFDCGPRVMPGEIIDSGFFIYCHCNEGFSWYSILEDRSIPPLVIACHPFSYHVSAALLYNIVALPALMLEWMHITWWDFWSLTINPWRQLCAAIFCKQRYGILQHFSIQHFSMISWWPPSRKNCINSFIIAK